MSVASTSVGEIGLDLVVNQEKFNKQLNGVKKAGEGAGKKLSKAFSKPFSSIKKEAASAEASVGKSFSGITSMAKKAGGVMAAAFAVRKLVDFGKECLELGSDLAEVQNVVDVTFPAMTAQIDAFAKSAASSFGLSETMAKKYTGTFGAMAKSFGFSEQQAAGMSTALTGLTGDVASFYNLSQDEAYTKLKSVFTGETESLKDLGVVMTQTALDAYAMSNGYGKVTAKMSEAEKVGLRYAFVQDKLQAAQGDFARTSDSWANQTKVLKLQVESLKATIGQGLINLFTPIIWVVNALIGKLGTLASAFKGFTELITGNKSAQGSGIGQLAAEASTGLSNAADSAENLEDNTSGVGKAAKKAAKEIRALMGFDQINRLDSAEDSSDSSLVPDTDFGDVDFGNLAEGETVLDNLNRKFDGVLDRFKELAGLFKKGFDLGFGDTDFNGLIKQFKRVGEALKDIFTDKRVTDAAKRMVDQLVKTLGVAVGSLARIAVKWGEAILSGIADALERDKEWIVNKLVSIMDTITKILKQISRIFLTLADIFTASNVLESLRGLADSITSCLITAVLVIADAAAKIGLAIITGIADSLEKNKQWIIDKLSSLFDAIAQIFDQIKRAFLILGDIFTAPQVLEAIRGLTESIMTCLTVIAFTAAETAAKIGLAIITGIVNGLENNKQWMIDSLTSLLDAWRGIFDNITAIVLDIAAILTSGDFLGSIQYCAEQITTAFMQVVYSAASIGTTTAQNLVGGIKLYLEQNSEFIKNALIGCINCVGEFSEIAGQLALAVADIFTVFSGDNAKRITADLIGIFSNSFLSIAELAGKFAVDLMDMIASPIINNKDKIKEAIDNTLSPISEVIHTIKDTVTEALTKIHRVYDEHIAPMFQAFRDGLSEIVETLLDGYNTHIAPVLDRLAEKFGKVWEEHVKPAIDSALKYLGKLADFIKDAWVNVLQPVINWIAKHIIPVVAPVLEGLGEAFLTVFGGIADSVKSLFDILSGIIDFISGVFSGDWERAWNGIKDIFGGIWDLAVSKLKTPLNAIISMFNGLLKAAEKVVNGIASIFNKIKIDIPDWVPVVGGKTLGFNLPKWTAPQIPKLAEGGFVKANTPQLAMIGDNRHQGEVVAPEEKLLEMAKMAAGMAGGDNGTLTAILQILQRILDYLLKNKVVVIDPETLRKYFIKETNARTMSSGVCELNV